MKKVLENKVRVLSLQKGILYTAEDKVVDVIDFRITSYSNVFDADVGSFSNFVKLVAWYDTESKWISKPCCM